MKPASLKFLAVMLSGVALVLGGLRPAAQTPPPAEAPAPNPPIIFGRPVTNQPVVPTNSIVQYTNRPAGFTNAPPGYTNRPPWLTNHPTWQTNRPAWLTNRAPVNTNRPPGFPSPAKP